MVTIEEIYQLEKVWIKAYDNAYRAEGILSPDDRQRYWVTVQIAWQVQRAIRAQIELKIDAYVKENIDSLMEGELIPTPSPR